MTRPPNVSDGSWLTWVCLSRASFTVIFTAYSAVMPLLTPEWGMSASQAGLIQSAWHAGYLVSLFTIGFLADRYGAKRTFLALERRRLRKRHGLRAVRRRLSVRRFAATVSPACVPAAPTRPGSRSVSERFVVGRRGRAMGFYLAAASFGYALVAVALQRARSRPGSAGAARSSSAPAGRSPPALLALWVLRATPNVVHPAPPNRPKSIRCARRAEKQAGDARRSGPMSSIRGNCSA